MSIIMPIHWRALAHYKGHGRERDMRYKTYEQEDIKIQIHFHQ